MKTNNSTSAWLRNAGKPSLSGFRSSWDLLWELWDPGPLGGRAAPDPQAAIERLAKNIDAVGSSLPRYHDRGAGVFTNPSSYNVSQKSIWLNGDGIWDLLLLVVVCIWRDFWGTLSDFISFDHNLFSFQFCLWKSIACFGLSECRKLEFIMTLS